MSRRRQVAAFSVYGVCTSASFSGILRHAASGNNTSTNVSATAADTYHKVTLISPTEERIMTDEEKGTNLGTVLLSFLTGAALGIGLTLLYSHREQDDQEGEYDDGPLFI